jgi:glucose/mannose transport system substrate-binding protein
MKVQFRFLSLLLAIAMMIAVVGQTHGVKAQDQKLSGKLEIYSWWAGGEAPALQALLDLYSKKYPDVQVTNPTVAGGAGTNAKAVLKTRMLGGNPPDSFQAHAGQELIGTYVVAGRMEPLTDLFKSEGWTDKMPKGLIDLISYKGDIWSVPVNIHRANVLWYVPANLKQWGIEVPKTLDDLWAVCETLKGKGIATLAQGGAFTTPHLWENIAIATLGAQGWNDLWTGKLNWTDDKVKAVWTNFGKALDCSNSDADSLGDWIPAAEMVLNGKAAFQIMGDWEAGYFTAVKNLEPGTGFGWAPAPGTAGVFDMLSDSFGLPKGIADKDNTIAWLKVLGSVEGQDAFNPLKGSIPARTDADPSKYNKYSQSALADWAKDTIVGSLTHGAAAPESFTSTFTTVLEVYGSTRDVELASNASQQLAIDSGIISK